MNTNNLCSLSRLQEKKKNISVFEGLKQKEGKSAVAWCGRGGFGAMEILPQHAASRRRGHQSFLWEEARGRSSSSSSSSEVPPQRPRPAREVPGLPAASHGMSTRCQCCCRQSSSNVWMMFAIKHQRQHPQLPNFCSCFCGLYFNSVNLMSFVSPLCRFTKVSFTTIPVCKCIASDWYQKVIPQFTTFCPLAFITVAINWGLIGTASSSVFN